jgi:peptide/nickel transport system substrate-binding protein
MSRRTRALSAAASLCAVGLAVSACSGTVKSPSGGAKSEGPAVSGGTLNMLGTGDIDYMDPNIAYYSGTYTALRMWSRQLFTNPAIVGKETTAAPDLATELPTVANGGISADGLTYNFKIRAGAKWNTTPARQVSAADTVRGVKRTCNPVQPFGGTPDFQDLIVGYAKFCESFATTGKSAKAMGDFIEKTDLPGVVAKDDTTVTFKLTHPAAYFVDMLTLPAFSPAPVEFNKYVPASAELAANTISDGPYKIDSYVATKSINLSRNPVWAAATDPIRKAYVDKIVVNETLTQDSVQQQLQTGSPSADMGWDTFPPANQLAALIAKKDPLLSLGDSISSNPFVLFNTVSPNNNKALGKVKVRQALSHALNRNNIIQVLGGPKVAVPLTHILPSEIVGGEKSFDLYPYDIAKAKQMLTEAGYPKGFTLKLLYRNKSAGNTKAFQTIQQDLSKVGVTVTGVPAANADFYTTYLSKADVAPRGVYDLAVEGWGPDWYGNAALSFFKPLFSGKPSFPPTGSNYGFYDSPAANKAIAAAENAPTVAEAKSLAAAADRAVMEDAAIFPITNPRTANYHAAQLHNAVHMPVLQQFDPTNVWIDKAKQGG